MGKPPGGIPRPPTDIEFSLKIQSQTGEGPFIIPKYVAVTLSR